MYNSKLFPESPLAHHYLDGLDGIEIGGSAHNAFGLNTKNVDRVPQDSPEFAPYAQEQMRLCGHVMPVDIVAPGDNLPLESKSVDFVISSHVIEHFFDPIAALKEWARVAREYIFIICPQRDALESDRDKPLTPIQELKDRHAGLIPRIETDEHHTRWTPETFREMCAAIGLNVCECLDPDDKVGNGFCVVIDLKS